MDNFSLVEIANEDLVAAKTLYSAKLYSQSVFSTQQSIEKLSKYFALDSNSVSFDELQKKIGHNSLEAFRISVIKLIENQDPSVLNETNLLTPDFPKLESKDDFLTQFNNVNSRDLQNLDEYHLDAVVKLIKDLNDAPHKLGLDLNSISNLDIIGLVKILKENYIIHEHDVNTIIDTANRYPVFRDYLNDLTRKFICNLPDYITAITTTFYCSVVFTRHAISSRYPSSKLDLNPSIYYSEESALVKRIPIFHLYLEKSIQAVIKFYRESPKSSLTS